MKKINRIYWIGAVALTCQILAGCNSSSPRPEVVDQGDSRDLVKNQANNLDSTPFMENQGPLATEPTIEKDPIPTPPSEGSVVISDTTDTMAEDEPQPDIKPIKDEESDDHTPIVVEVEDENPREIEGEGLQDESNTVVDVNGPEVHQDPEPIISTKGNPLGVTTAKINTFGDTMAFHYEEDSLREGYWNRQTKLIPTCWYSEDPGFCAVNHKTRAYFWQFGMKKEILNPGLLIKDPDPTLSDPSPEFLGANGSITTDLIPEANGDHPDFMILTSCYGNPSVVETTPGDQDIIVLANDSDIYRRTIDYNSFDDFSDFLAVPTLISGLERKTLENPKDQEAAMKLVSYLSSPGMTIPGKDTLADKSSLYAKIMRVFICKVGLSKRECNMVTDNQNTEN